jgi:hypothetical protein
MALLPKRILGDISRCLGTCTYVHFGRNTESMMAPDGLSHFPLKSASVMEVFMVTGLLL